MVSFFREIRASEPHNISRWKNSSACLSGAKFSIARLILLVVICPLYYLNSVRLPKMTILIVVKSRPRSPHEYNQMAAIREHNDAILSTASRIYIALSPARWMDLSQTWYLWYSAVLWSCYYPEWNRDENCGRWRNYFVCGYIYFIKNSYYCRCREFTVHSRRSCWQTRKTRQQGGCGLMRSRRIFNMDSRETSIISRANGFN